MANDIVHITFIRLLSMTILAASDTFSGRSDSGHFFVGIPVIILS